MLWRCVVVIVDGEGTPKRILDFNESVNRDGS
jgi:hypothetical protein